MSFSPLLPQSTGWRMHTGADEQNLLIYITLNTLCSLREKCYYIQICTFKVLTKLYSYKITYKIGREIEEERRWGEEEKKSKGETRKGWRKEAGGRPSNSTMFFVPIVPHI